MESGEPSGGDQAAWPIAAVAPSDPRPSLPISQTLDLFIYSRGGAIDVPWRIVTALRQTSDEWRDRSGRIVERAQQAD
jgi:hypothetical protein